MGRSQETFGKKEREKKRLKKRKEKEAKREARKENNMKGESFDNMISYVDEYGNPTDTPPDQARKVKIDPSTIEISVAKKEEEEYDPIRTGKVAFFKDDKGYGFITDAEDQEKYFYHINNTIDEIGEGDKVSFELERGQKGLNAVRIKKI
jgi:cold shock CspA family protein